VWQVKEPLLLKALSAKHRSEFAAQSSVMVTATRKIVHAVQNNHTSKQKKECQRYCLKGYYDFVFKDLKRRKKAFFFVYVIRLKNMKSKIILFTISYQFCKILYLKCLTTFPRLKIFKTKNMNGYFILLYGSIVLLTAQARCNEDEEIALLGSYLSNIALY
jgi:hypothetical protein